MPTRSVLLLGDDVRRSIQRRVAELLAEDGIAAIWPEASTGRAACLAEGVEDWLAQFSPDIAVFGAGPWSREELANPESIEADSYAEYQVNLGRIADVLRRECGRNVGFFTMPPIDGERLARGGKIGGERADAAARLEGAIAAYNGIATAFLGSANVMSEDLHHRLLPRADEWLEADGFTLSEDGVREAAQAVANLVYAVL